MLYLLSAICCVVRLEPAIYYEGWCADSDRRGWTLDCVFLSLTIRTAPTSVDKAAGLQTLRLLWVRATAWVYPFVHRFTETAPLKEDMTPYGTLQPSQRVESFISRERSFRIYNLCRWKLPAKRVTIFPIFKQFNTCQLQSLNSISVFLRM